MHGTLFTDVDGCALAGTQPQNAANNITKIDLTNVMKPRLRRNCIHATAETALR